MDYISSWWGKPKGTNADRGKLLYCNIDSFELENKIRKCVTLVYPTGLQIWDITSLDRVFEIYSETGKFFKIAKIIPTAAKETQEDSLYSERPVIGILTDDETSPKSKLLLQSLKTGEVITMEPKGKMTNFYCNKHVYCFVIIISSFCSP